MLLPASDAHLVTIPGGELKDGLEMKVKLQLPVFTSLFWQVTLSGVTKSSLGELSGGQRSLLALALVLALLKYKVRLNYIFDLSYFSLLLFIFWMRSTQLWIWATHNELVKRWPITIEDDDDQSCDRENDTSTIWWISIPCCITQREPLQLRRRLVQVQCPLLNEKSCLLQNKFFGGFIASPAHWKRS